MSPLTSSRCNLPPQTTAKRRSRRRNFGRSPPRGLFQCDLLLQHETHGLTRKATLDVSRKLIPGAGNRVGHRFWSRVGRDRRRARIRRQQCPQNPPPFPVVRERAALVRPHPFSDPVPDPSNVPFGTRLVAANATDPCIPSTGTSMANTKANAKFREIRLRKCTASLEHITWYMSSRLYLADRQADSSDLVLPLGSAAPATYCPPDGVAPRHPPKWPLGAVTPGLRGRAAYALRPGAQAAGSRTCAPP